MPTFASAQGNWQFVDEGAGPVVVLLHGLGSCGDDWRPQIDALAPYYRVLAPDLRGHGASASPPAPWTIADFADDILRLLDHLGIPQVHVAGLSLGGMVSIELACRSPSRLTSICVINAMPLAGPRPRSLWIGYWLRRFVIRLVGLKGLGKMIGRKIFPRPDQQALIDKFVAQMEQMSTASYLASLNAIVNWQIEPDYAKLTMPALILAADQDYSPVDMKREFATKLPRGRLEIIADSRHASPFDQPEAVNQSLLNFFAASRDTTNI